tara:strand:- start:323 stop:994 length:672 start_codon:yes stop_codon:yes gene_type:complete
MLNCGLTDLRLVRPRNGWPNANAEAMAAGASAVLERATVHETTKDAVGEFDLVLATTARERDMTKTVLTPKVAAERMKIHLARGGQVGVLFGPERAGLINDDVVLADAVINVPLNPAFSSLNLAQAVLLVGYEWYQISGVPALVSDWESAPPASVEEREYFFARLENELEIAGFLYPPNLAPTIRRNIRNMFNRSSLTDQEVRTLHGVLSALVNVKRDLKRAD